MLYKGERAGLVVAAMMGESLHPLLRNSFNIKANSHIRPCCVAQAKTRDPGYRTKYDTYETRVTTGKSSLCAWCLLSNR
ncbi:hypothetical protein INR49_014884 [Caranx melampygus]|nr:hypothetical protein INR49_014884 [Caranx melampygus]